MIAGFRHFEERVGDFGISLDRATLQFSAEMSPQRLRSYVEYHGDLLLWNPQSGHRFYEPVVFFSR